MPALRRNREKLIAPKEKAVQWSSLQLLFLPSSVLLMGRQDNPPCFSIGLSYPGGMYCGLAGYSTSSLNVVTRLIAHGASNNTLLGL